MWYVDRKTGRLEREQVVAEAAMRWLYGEGRLARLARRLVRRRLVSRLYGWWQDRPASRARIRRFIEQAGVDASEAEKPPEAYRSLNAFFARRLRPGARPLDPDPAALLSPADARVLAWQDPPGGGVPIKGRVVPVASVLGLASPPPVGAVFVLRLAPGDYHRFHFPATGRAEPSVRIPGGYDSVNPIALARDPCILCENERQRCRLETEAFGPVWLVEIGALFVGRIVQTYRPGPVERGAEKGYFQFGGSTVLVCCAPGRLTVAADLLENTARGYETRLRMGVAIARRC
ncbi:MAG: phosphatidylserine decarboxylase [Planctomycetota bacterium]|nr:MAG: phosphatidylserine decarboxylase [Planctomycetota bacterium]